MVQVIATTRSSFQRFGFANYIASKEAYKASFENMMQRITQERIDDERKRKMGGGGGSIRRFDRIAVSMMLSNFLSNKTIQAMINNMNSIFLKTQDLNNLLRRLADNKFINSSIKWISIAFSGINNFIVGLKSKLGFESILKQSLPFIKELNKFAQAFSFHLNKFKKILKDDMKEKIKKLNIKNKVLKVLETVFDFIVDVKEDIFKSFLKFVET